MKQPIIPLSVPAFKGNEWRYVKECLDSGWVSSAGKFVEEFEEKLRKKIGAKYAVACVNGTSGLQLSLRLAGVDRGDEVIAPTLTFIATANAVRYLGAEPVFMDCDDHMNIDPDKIENFCRRECAVTKDGLKNRASNRIIKAIMPVHVFGNPCNLGDLIDVAAKYHLKVIEDATESLGAYYIEGRYKDKFTGTIGDFGVYSFNGNKIVTCGGGGMIITKDEKQALRARHLSTQAKDDPIRHIHNEVGYNFKLTSLQAALGIAQLEALECFIKIKKRNYELYKKRLEAVEGAELLGIPDGTSPNYWLYSLIIDKKRYGMDIEELMRHLKANGIQARPVWYLNHLQRPYINNRSYRIEKASWFWRNTLNIPSSSNLTENEIDKVASTIKRLKG